MGYKKIWAFSFGCQQLLLMAMEQLMEGGLARACVCGGGGGKWLFSFPQLFLTQVRHQLSVKTLGSSMAAIHSVLSFETVRVVSMRP